MLKNSIFILLAFWLSFGSYANDGVTAACPTISMSGNGVFCYGQSTGKAKVTITNTNGSNGSNSFTISWSNGGPFTIVGLTSEITNLPAGTYTVNVKDNNSGCTVVGAYVVGSPDPLAISSTITNLSCKGVNTGSIALSVVGGNGGNTYAWSPNVGSTATVSGLAANTYNVVVTDSKGCSASRSLVVTEPAQALNGSGLVVGASCAGSATGSINVDVWGGTAPYTYLWSSGQTTQDVSNLTAGNYSVVITDAKLCTKSLPFNITQPAVLGGSLSATDVLCYGNADGSISFSPTGGTAPYSYSWQNSTTLYSSSSPSLSNVVADDYQVTMTDAKGCKFIATSTIDQPPLLVISSTGVNVDCFGAFTGSIDLTISGGTTPYTQGWTNSVGASFGNGEDLTSIPAEDYTVLVSDGNGCTSTLTHTITQPNLPISVTEEVTHVLCYGNNTGAINLTIIGGTTPYTYAWLSGQTTEDISGLLADTYGYTLTDDNGCQFSNALVVSQPAQPLQVTDVITDVNCFGESNGGIDLTVTGGTSPYVYEWANSSYLLSITNQDLVNYPADTYRYKVTDNNGCTFFDTLDINEPPILTTSVVGVNILCKGGNNGSVDLTVNGGVLPYVFSWNNAATVEDIDNLVAGYYEVLVTDDHNCTITDFITLTEPLDSLKFTYEVEDVKCNDGEDGTIDLSITGGTQNYDYLWSNGDVVPQISNLTAGYYTFLITDANNCLLTDSIYVDQPDPLTLNELITAVTCYGFVDGIIDISPLGGTMPYNYTWFNSDFGLSAQTEDLVDYPADVYQLEIIDSNNCFYEMFLEIVQPELLVIEYTYNVVSCSGGTDGNIYVDITGGNPAYITNWSNGATTEDLLNIPYNSYQLIVTDQKSCTDSIFVGIAEPAPITMTFDIEEVTCIDQLDGKAYAFPEGGNGGYVYEWSNGDNTYLADELQNQIYSLTVYDVLGCSGVDQVYIPRSLIGCVDPVTAFTPNGDNYNDTWIIDNMYLYPESEVQIFNRWGNLIYDIKGEYVPWNGVVNGADMPSDTYYYIINLNAPEKEPLIGNITIVR
jgi:gliding motility-associated-like protein